MPGTAASGTETAVFLTAGGSKCFPPGDRSRSFRKPTTYRCRAVQIRHEITISHVGAKCRAKCVRTAAEQNAVVGEASQPLEAQRLSLASDFDEVRLQPRLHIQHEYEDQRWIASDRTNLMGSPFLQSRALLETIYFDRDAEYENSI